ncbi:MAG: hypothetical protein ACOY3O_13690 [Thermodesulfobacteriota bacterium]
MDRLAPRRYDEVVVARGEFITLYSTRPAGLLPRTGGDLRWQAWPPGGVADASLEEIGDSLNERSVRPC